jgi:protein phosphatase
VRFATGRATHQGRVRANNEDAYLVDEEHRLFAVADGMGGHLGGEVASHTAIEALRAAVASGASMKDAIERANDAVLDKASADAELTGMGTTLTAITVVGPSQLLIGHVGDSRAYRLREGAPMERLTLDHSLVEELVRQGRLTPEQAESHPQRAIVTRALGVDYGVEVDTYPLAVEAGDRIVLCSDGLTTMVRETDVDRIARTETDPKRAAEALVAAANDNGGEDNTTVVVIDVLEVEPPPTAAAAAAATTAPAEEPAESPLEAPAGQPVAGPEPEPRIAPSPPRARAVRARLRSARGVLVVVLPVVAIVGAATGALGWYARGSYYVGARGGEVVIFKGVPGGVLGWDPTIDERTGIALDDLVPYDRDRVVTNSTRGSLATAQGFVTRLRDAIAATSTTTAATTTTRAPSRTTTPRPRSTTTRTTP